MLAELGTPAARGTPKKEEEKTWAGRLVVGWLAGGRILVRVGLAQLWRVTGGARWFGGGRLYHGSGDDGKQGPCEVAGGVGRGREERGDLHSTSLTGRVEGERM